jgi:hypothetical protein
MAYGIDDIFCRTSTHSRICNSDTDQMSAVQNVAIEVPGMILLQAHLHIYSLLRGVTFEVLPLSSYELSPTILPHFFGVPVVE